MTGNVVTRRLRIDEKQPDFTYKHHTVQIKSPKVSMKPGAPPLQSARLLDQVRERVRYLHYSLKTEKAYLYWLRFSSAGVLPSLAACAIPETWGFMMERHFCP